MTTAMAKETQPQIESASDVSQSETGLKHQDVGHVEQKEKAGTDATAGTSSYGIDAAHQKRVM